MTTWARRVMVALRHYPITIFWLTTCAAFAAGVANALVALAFALLAELALVAHVVAHVAVHVYNPPATRDKGHQP